MMLGNTGGFAAAAGRLSARSYVQDGLIAILDDESGFRSRRTDQLPAFGDSWTVEICMTFDSWRTSNNGSYFTPDPWVDHICELYEYPIGSHYINMKTSSGEWRSSQIQRKGFQTLGCLSDGNGKRSSIFLDGKILATQNSSRPVTSAKVYRASQVQPTGCIYSSRVYNRALSAAEIAANHAIDVARFNPNGGGCISA